MSDAPGLRPTPLDGPAPASSPLDAALSRRRLLQLSAAAGAASFLAACGVAGTKTPGASNVAGGPTGAPGSSASGGPAGSAGASAAPSPSAAPTAVTGVFKMASWLGYIDVSDDGPNHPSLERFTEETGVAIDYQEAVNANEEFFAAQLQGPLRSNVATGWDVVVLSDWMIIRLVKLGWLEEITPGASFPANLAETYTTRDWDPDNRFAAPWQSGMTGLGYDRKRTGEITSLAAFFTDAYAGKVTYQSEMRDTVGLAALYLGSSPTTLTQEQFDAAIGLIKQSIDASIVRQLTGNDYVEGLKTRDVTVAMAWSGDVTTLLVPEQSANQDFQWTLPKEGGMLWTDSMCIPKGARNKAQAEVFINWYYQPANAAEIEAWVNYVCPVRGADAELIKIDEALGSNPLIFPTPEMTARLHEFTALDVDTASKWEADFAEAIGI
ncbi:MAG: spermidine/putrescine transport system substrate-binding protein [Chloroflexota bacterium]|jgi:spermidine/putrescine transport system substrate-binding protein|nr:spermidine/putrescine transport system substrate-binding protein [Chloroflexota bacterium]